MPDIYALKSNRIIIMEWSKIIHRFIKFNVALLRSFSTSSISVSIFSVIDYFPSVGEELAKEKVPISLSYSTVEIVNEITYYFNLFYLFSLKVQIFSRRKNTENLPNDLKCIPNSYFPLHIMFTFINCFIVTWNIHCFQFFNGDVPMCNYFSNSCVLKN